MLNVSAVNSAPSVLAPNLMTLPNDSVDVDLRPLVSDVETAGAVIRFQVSNPVGGSVTLLGDGHTARFMPALNYSGPASFSYIATDTAGDGAPDARWLLHYDF